MASIDDAVRETEETLHGDAGEPLDLSYITEDVLRSLEEAEEVTEEMLREHTEADPPEGAEPPSDVQPEALQIIYGHSLVVIGAAHYFKLVQSGTWRCLNTGYYRWPQVSGRRWVGTCSPGNGKWQLMRWT